MERTPSGVRRAVPLFGAAEAMAAGEEIIHRVGGSLPRSVVIAGRERQAAFFEQELAEADQRGWPPEMKALFEQQRDLNAAALAELKPPEADVIPIDREADASLRTPAAVAMTAQVAPVMA